jgi:hypothetical protein
MEYLQINTDHVTHYSCSSPTLEKVFLEIIQISSMENEESNDRKI